MRNNKALIVAIIILFIAISSVVSSFVIYKAIGDEQTTVELPSASAMPSCYIQETLEPTFSPSPTPAPTQLPEKPKYIFYIIGDGMGYSHLLLGSVYEKINNGDFSYTPYWDMFEMQKDCIPGRESAGGGTMLATGYDAEMDKIAVDRDGNELVTILDRASQAGMSTGVISNSYITDATPATFLVHTKDRGQYQNVISGIPYSGVDFIASGGMNYLLSEEDENEFGSRDICGNRYSFKGQEGAKDNYSMEGYTSLLGKQASDFIAGPEAFSFNADKLFMLFVSKNMSYQRTKYGSRQKDMEIHEPDLDELTTAGIDFLSKNENGFVLVVEEALIDKASHNNWMEITSVEMHMINRTLGAVFEFYNEHPYETLIIFTADHETGDLTYNEQFANSINDMHSVDVNQSADEIYNIIKAEWGINLSYDKIAEKKDTAEQNIWGSYDRNYTLLNCYLAASLVIDNGITFTSKYHSYQNVPLYATGVKAELFSGCEHIYDISTTICELMGWDKLPEIIE